MTDSQQRKGETPTGNVPPEIQSAPRIATPTPRSGEVVSTGAPQLDEAHSAFAEFHQSYVTGYIQFADTKAGWAFALASGLIAYIFSNEKFSKILFHPVFTLSSLLLSGTTVLLILSAALSFLVIVPRFKSSGEGLVYFGAVAKKRAANDYIQEIASAGESALTEARLKHSYDISRICAQKYKLLRAAFWLGALGLIGMAIILMMTSLASAASASYSYRTAL